MHEEEQPQHFEDTAHAESMGGGFGDPPAKPAKSTKKEAAAAKPAGEPNP